jgi:hypothetical protein
VTLLTDLASSSRRRRQGLRQSGMHWTVNGADAIIASRCADAS